MTYVPVKTYKGHERHGLSQWHTADNRGYDFRICNRDFCECVRECCYQQRKTNDVTEKTR